MGLLLVSSMTFCIDIDVFFFEIFKFLLCFIVMMETLSLKSERERIHFETKNITLIFNKWFRIIRIFNL